MVNEKAEQILTAARGVFMRYGYRRVTMADLAKAAQMSRPALYLIFPSKEEIFALVITRLADESLQRIREGIKPLKTVDAKLELALEVWYAQPYEVVLGSPDAADLYESIKEVASDVIVKAAADFESVLVDILGPPIRKQKSLKLSPQRVARVVRTAAKGLNVAAHDATDLRQMLGDLRKMVLASIGETGK